MRLAFVILAACTAAPAVTSPPRRPREVKLAELGDVRAFRNYVAVIGVGPHGAHFTAWYDHIEQSYTRVVAYSDGAGHLVIEEEAGGWGGIAMPPQSPPAIPHDAEKLAHTVLDELERRHPASRNWQLRFDGFSRSVAITELIAHDFATGTRRAGWNAHLTVAMDRELAHVQRVISSRSGFGLIEVPADAQWVELPFAVDGRELLVASDVPQALVPSIGDAAQRFAANAASPPLASLVPPGERMLPDGYDAQVAAKISIYGRTAQGNSFDRDLRVSLDLRAAVFGDHAAGEAVATLDGRRYTVRVVLTPAAPRKPAPGHTSDRYTGTLAVHVDDNEGHAWDHAYPASGKLELEGDQVVAPAGLQIPGASAPSKENDALHGQLPGFGKSTMVDVYVAVDVFAEPRR